MLKLARRMMQTFALALGLEETYFDKITTAPFASSKIIHYPPQEPTSMDETGAPSHTDFESILLTHSLRYTNI